MPEGDTLFAVREALRPDLLNERLIRVDLHGRRARSLERRVVRLMTMAKHLFIELDSGEMVRTHLGMHGTWHRYKHETPWRIDPRQASLALWTERLVAVCFRAKEVECLTARAVRTHRTLSRLGPDLLAEGFDDGWWQKILERSFHFGEENAPVVDLLLDQRVAGGIGNVYKSETLFLERVHPRRRIGSIGRAQRRSLFHRARSLMLANLGPWWRTTTVDRRHEARPPQRLWVYGRGGEECSQCANRVQFARFGFGRRSTYWCEACQPPVLEGSSPE